MKINFTCFATAITLSMCVAIAEQPPTGQTQPAVNREKDASDLLFDRGEIPRLRIEIPDDQLNKLKEDARSYVRCSIVESGGKTYKDVAIKLKGAAGSFRELDDKPAFTVNSDKFNRDQTFHDLDKFHLNNSVQDETYTQEILCSEIFRSMGIPTPRATHAQVWLNGRDLGLYGLKEGFDKRFLKRHFAKNNGNLYDGGFLQDIDAELQKDAGSGANDRSDLQELLAACREPFLERRWIRVAEQIDVDKFLTFTALELMMGHWDGYTANRNNYRLYFDPTNKKACFMPHGMDQMFGDPNASILDLPTGIVSTTVMQNPQWRIKYRQKIGELVPLFSPAGKLLRRVDEIQQRIQPLLNEIDPKLAEQHDQQIKEFKERLVARAENLIEQNKMPDPQPLSFDDRGIARLPNDWYPVSESEDAKLEEMELPSKKKTFTIKCGTSETCVASWRHKVLLAKGTYRLQALSRTANVAALDDEKGSGAGIRISGENRSNKIVGTSSTWRLLTFEFQVIEEVSRVELVAELRATKGQAWFDRESMSLVRLKK